MSKITIDPKAKAIYVRLHEGKVARTKEFSEDIFADLDSSGRLLGVEVLRPGRLVIHQVAQRFRRPLLDKIAPELERLYAKLEGAR